MCEECQDLAPNTTIPGILFEWMRSQCFMTRRIQKIEEAMSLFGLDLSEYSKVVNTFKDPEFLQWAKDKTGIYWPQYGYSGSFSNVTASTMVGLYKYYRAKK